MVLLKKDLCICEKKYKIVFIFLKKMKLLSIYNKNEENILRQISRVVTQEDWDLWLVHKIIQIMQEYALKYPNSVWYSAIQFGYPLQIFYINCRPTESFPHITNIFQEFIINPVLLNKSDEIFLWYEWCMSIVDEKGVPTFRWMVERSTSVEFNYTNIHNSYIENKKLSWFTAVIFQHEFDHLNWILIDQSGFAKITNQEYLDKKNNWEKWLYLEY